MQFNFIDTWEKTVDKIIWHYHDKKGGVSTFETNIPKRIYLNQRALKKFKCLILTRNMNEHKLTISNCCPN